MTDTPDTSLLAQATAIIYWLLILTWSAILVFYLREYRKLRPLNPLIATLIVVIFIDGARTLIESGFFGVWYTARVGWLPYYLYGLLAEPEFVFIPKFLNLAAAIIIILFLVSRWFANVEDETRRHRELAAAHEELTRLERLRDDLVHMIAHDMRTPLTVIIGSLETARGDLADPVANELIDNSLEEAGRLRSMTANLLDVRRLESQELPLHLEPVTVAEALRDAARAVGRLAEGAGVALAVEPDGAELVTADRAVLGRVLVNLLQNALQHTPAGGRVTLSAEPIDGQVRLVVADTGEGIADDVRDRIFDRFFHASRQEGRAVASIGLGLAFCKLAVEAHGGEIGVESELGRGSRFYITLPVTA